PETLAAYFEERKVQFRAPEYRKLSFVMITPEEIGKWSTVSDEEARKLYDDRKDQMGTPEKRQVEQIVFPTIQEATAARGRLNDSFSFE
ncbi:peptidyl-prolyl cis-trans isomerase, partial [Acinetobacter baumannii]